MKLVEYIKNKFFSIIIYVLFLVLTVSLLMLYDASLIILIFIPIFFIITPLICFFHDYIKKREFYNNLEKKLNELDKKYLILEMIKSPNFIEGELLVENLYDINKSFIEEVNKYKSSSEELKEYIEMWCHEIKTPIATSKLIIDNNKNDVTLDILEEIEKVEAFVEQVLYYARSEVVEKDYLISKVDLKETINAIIRKNKKSLISKKIKIEIFDENVMIESDIKWLEFIFNQIISNSIKYAKDIDAKIKLTYKDNKNNIMLYIEDNGIGIEKGELKRVFEKGFTGSNGRKKYNSTGMGLFICKKLCEKLGHNIFIDSEEKQKTIVTIVFPKSSMTNM